MNCHQLFSTDYGKEPALETRLALLVRSVADVHTLGKIRQKPQPPPEKPFGFDLNSFYHKFREISLIFR